MPKTSFKSKKTIEKMLPKVKSNMKIELDRKFSAIEAKNNKLSSDQVMNNNILNNVRADYIRKILQAMISLGVDPNNLESINKFLASFEAKDPDMFSLFEQSMNNLLSSDNGQGVSGSGDSGVNLMDRFKNLGAEMMMPRQ